MTCINCDNEHNSSFCPNCGEYSKVAKITFASIFQNGLSTITNMDKGFFFNVKNLLLKPNELVHDYIRGKRKNIFNPISFLIISVTIYIISDSLIDVSADKSKSRVDSEVYKISFAAGKFIHVYFKYFWILSILWLGFATKIIYRRYNYAEHLAISSFVIGQATLVGLLGFVLFKQPLIFNPIMYLVIVWMLYKIFDQEKYNNIESSFLAFAAMCLFFILLVAITFLIGYLVIL